jgi:hypothetical protein
MDPQQAWYGLDPIHICRRCFHPAWATMLAPWRDGNGDGDDNAACKPMRPAPRRWLRLRTSHPQRRWWFGRDMTHAQPCARWGDGTVWMY